MPAGHIGAGVYSLLKPSRQSPESHPANNMSSLKVHLSILENEEEYLSGTSPAESLDLMIDDEMISSTRPLTFDLKASLLDNEVLVSGSFSIPFDCTCVRCLSPFTKLIQFDKWTASLAITGEDKAEINGDCIDLLPLIREDVLLSLPQHPLCSPDCAVFRQPNRSAADLTPESPQDEDEPSPWGALDKLNLDSKDNN